MSDTPVSTRRVFHTLLDWAGLRRGAQPARGDAGRGRARRGDEAVPRVRLAAAGHGGRRAATRRSSPDARGLRRRRPIPARRATSATARDLPGRCATALRGLSRAVAGRRARRRRPLDDEARRRLASLGYVSAGAAPVVRKDAPRPADMTRAVRRRSTRRRACSCASEYAAGDSAARADPAPRIPYNLDAALRLATAHSSLGHDGRARRPRSSGRARSRRDSPDVRTYLALHYARGTEWARAVPLLEQVVAESPDRLPALEALAAVRERQGRVAGRAGAAPARLRAAAADRRRSCVRLGQLAMAAQQTTPRSRRSRRRARRTARRVPARPRAGRAVPGRAAAAGGARRARPRARRRIPSTRWRSSSARR